MRTHGKEQRSIRLFVARRKSKLGISEAMFSNHTYHGTKLMSRAISFFFSSFFFFILES